MNTIIPLVIFFTVHIVVIANLLWRKTQLNAGHIQYIIILCIFNDGLLILNEKITGFDYHANILYDYFMLFFVLPLIPIMKLYIYDKAMILRGVGIKPTTTNLNRYGVEKKHKIFVLFMYMVSTLTAFLLLIGMI